MPDRLTAPWTIDQVDALNAYQAGAPMHPFTCPFRDDSHRRPGPGDRDFGVLVATEEGWICLDCTYTQNWAYPWMADLSWWAM